MKILLLTLLVFVGFTATAQTSQELIGKWKLVKETKNGVDKEIKEETYQVFSEGGVFQGIVGNKTRKGKWELSENNKILTVKVSIITVNFTVDFFDAKRRIISSDATGTLEYEKVVN